MVHINALLLRIYKKLSFNTMPSQQLNNIDSLLDQYEVFLIDAWGVLHDGHTLYPGAKETLQLLNKAHKHCLIISNAIRRHDDFKQHLLQLGIGADLYTDVVTSGELCWQAFNHGCDAELVSLGISKAKRCYHLSTESGQDYVHDFEFELVNDINQAHFILNTLAGGNFTVNDYSGLLEKANRLSLPMVCPNPDVMAIKGGQPIITAGAIAKAFQALGGQVKYFGKPYASIYEHCFSLFKSHEPASFLAIGDGLPTDIKGANSEGIECILLASGIHHQELQIDSQEAVFQRYAATPTYLLDTLQRG